MRPLSGMANAIAYCLLVVALFFVSPIYAESVPVGYEVTDGKDAVMQRLEGRAGKSDADIAHDLLVAEVVKKFKDNCTVYVAKPATGKSGTTVDLIIHCKRSEKCAHGKVYLIEVKAPTGIDEALKQLEAGSKAALDAGVIEKKPDPASLKDCYKSIILTPKGKPLEKKKNLALPESKTPIGDQKITPQTTDNVNDLPTL